MLTGKELVLEKQWCETKRDRWVRVTPGRLLVAKLGVDIILWGNGVSVLNDSFPVEERHDQCLRKFAWAAMCKSHSKGKN